MGEDFDQAGCLARDPAAGGESFRLPGVVGRLPVDGATDWGGGIGNPPAIWRPDRVPPARLSHSEAGAGLARDILESVFGNTIIQSHAGTIGGEAGINIIARCDR